MLVHARSAGQKLAESRRAYGKARDTPMEDQME